ncbi:MAG: hypothetical protein AAFQ95_20180 [Cyanobacteria bacterium J06621_3]
MVASKKAIQAVGEQISVAGQLSPQQIQQLPAQGLKAVINFRAYQ